MSKERPLLPIGTVLNGKWVILEFIARGGMGEVYRAHQINLKRDVAIKIVSREWLKTFIDDPEELESALRRFRQEVETMVQIRHPNVIQIYDYDKARVELPEGQVEVEYIVLEYIPGRTLRSTMREEGFYPSEKEIRTWIEKYFLPVLEGVKTIHRAGIFHRDLKPENILLDRDIPKIADFGLARSIKLESITSSLEIKGTPAYMAPEQFVDFKGTDQRADIYALGKILYEAVAGKIPPSARPFTQVGLKEAPTPFFQALDRIIRKATEEDPDKRFTSVEEMEKALKEALALQERGKAPPSKVRSKPPLWLATIIVAGLLLLGGISYYLWQRIHSAQHHEVQLALSPELTRQFPAVKISSDGAVMRLLPGGEIKVPPGFLGPAPRTVTLKPFYLDEYPVTNHQYVIFLNEVSSQIRVEDGVVKQGDQVWLYLGKVSENYEPIIYEGKRFLVQNPIYASCPVVRVTALGALAYAKHYGKRLPTKVEWFYALTEGRGLRGLQLEVPDDFYKHFELPVSVMDLKPNALGIRGLSTHFGEWVEDSVLPSPKAEIVLISGLKLHEPSQTLSLAPVKRMPWEAFEEVGFRCAQDTKRSEPKIKPKAPEIIRMPKSPET